MWQVEERAAAAEAALAAMAKDAQAAKLRLESVLREAKHQETLYAHLEGKFEDAVKRCKKYEKTLSTPQTLTLKS